MSYTTDASIAKDKLRELESLKAWIMGQWGGATEEDKKALRAWHTELVQESLAVRKQYNVIL